MECGWWGLWNILWDSSRWACHIWAIQHWRRIVELWRCWHLQRLLARWLIIRLCFYFLLPIPSWVLGTRTYSKSTHSILFHQRLCWIQHPCITTNSWNPQFCLFSSLINFIKKLLSMLSNKLKPLSLNIILSSEPTQTLWYWCTSALNIKA